MNSTATRPDFNAMLICRFVTVLCLSLLALSIEATANSPTLANTAQQDDKLENLILDLDEARSESSRSKLLAQIKALGAKVIPGLENPPEGLTQQTRLLLQKLKNELEQTVDQQTVQPAEFSLSGKMTLAQALKKIESQCGVSLIVTKPEQEVREIDLVNREFWRGLDELLDLFQYDVSQFSKPGTVELIPSDRGTKRSQRGSYAGLARLEATHYFASSDLIRDEQSFDRIRLDIRWEPRIQPYEMIMDYGSITVIDGDGNVHQSLSKNSVEMPVAKSESGKRLDIRFDSIPRSCNEIKSIRGKTVLMTPVGRRKFRFEKVADSSKKQQRIGETTITIKSVKWSDSALKVALEFQIQNAGNSLESHRGWMFRNRAFLVDKKSREILPTKTMTTAQEKDKMGFVFVFDTIDGPEGFDFVYESPTSIRKIPLDWKLGKIEIK